MMIKVIKSIAAVILVTPLAYFIIAIVSSFIPSKFGTEKTEKEDYSVFVGTNGVHLDLIIPNTSLSGDLQEGMETPGNYTSYGWGDKEFFLNTPEWKDLTFGTAINALFRESETLMHASYYNTPSESWIKLPVNLAKKDCLCDYVKGSFKTDSALKFIKIPNAHYSYNDSFYEAKGSYNCFYTCNTWVNSAFKKCDIKTALWTPFDFGVLHHLN